MSSRRRVVGSGRLSRIVAFPCFVVAGASFVAHLAASGGFNWTLRDVIASIFFALASLAFARSLTLGVWMRPNGIEYVSWFRRGFVDWVDLIAVDSVPYAGFLTKGAMSRRLREIVIVTRRPAWVQVGGSVAFSKLSHVQVRQLKAAHSLVASARGLEHLP